MKDRIEQDPNLLLLDVREPHELEIAAIEGAKNIPLGEVAQRMYELDSAEEMIVFCKRGSRSARAIEILASAGFKKMKNLKGGINAWAEEVDTSLPLY
jgi:adenylyltransferase/sulfurtransferase